MWSSDRSMGDSGKLFETQSKPHPESDATFELDPQVTVLIEHCSRTAYPLELDGWRRKQFQSYDASAVSSPKKIRRWS